ncbi:MAG: calcium-translocating P-type ATPase, PMCA-type [Clostridia bacterium]|nr:calcium-translocating P-type ATPase, PMCA-type [Clostridia bacterium]
MWQALNLSEVKQKLKTNYQYGLTNEEVDKRFQECGENKLEDKPKESLVVKFFKQFNDFMIIILIIAAIVSALIEKMQGSNDYLDSIIIIAIVVFNAIMGIIQEAKAEKSLEALKKMTAPVVKVRREGRIRQIKSNELVPGDIVILEAGNFVPADCRLISSYNLKAEESSLTGETVPVEKNASIILEEKTGIGDCFNMVFATTVIVNGHGEAVVTETGMNTKVGKIAKMIITNEAPETPIQRKLSEVGKTLGLACLGICALIFFIGIIKRIPPIEMFMTSVGLAVAAIPEGLPAIVTIVLSIGVTKMAKKNSIIRKLPAVETLGSSSVICSDKTGTLTQNKMQVVEVLTPNINSAINKKEKSNLTIELATMCTDVEISYDDGKANVSGDPTEVAIVEECYKLGVTKKSLYNQFERVGDIPFDSSRKMMTTIHKIGDRYRIITKGAPDILIKKCSKYYLNDQISSLGTSIIRLIEQQNEKMAEKALRVIAVAYKDVDALPIKLESNYVENDLIFTGLIGMIDPPREGVKEAIATCRKAGIKTVMITGDHITTANAIATELGILKKNDLSITGAELDRLPKTEFKNNIMKYSVFARVTPEHKVEIVKAFQGTGAVVAMTGDGVTDAPALKNADIGIAMGQNGTDVAKNAADMVLTDDNFVTIVEAVKYGRTIFNNIKKAIHFLIATNVGEIVTIFLGLLIGMRSPLLAIQLLWINLITDSLPAIALGLENPEKNIMSEKPRNPKKSIFSDGLWGRIIVEGSMIGILNLLAFTIGKSYYGLEVGRTMAFISLGLSELIHSFNIRSEESIFKAGLFENKYLIMAFLGGAFLQTIVAVVPQFAQIFKLTNLTGKQWLYTIGISFTPIILIEIQKFVNQLKFGKIIRKENTNKAITA